MRKVNANSYYVVEKNRFSGEVTVAKLDAETGQFYDYITRYGVCDMEIGQEVALGTASHGFIMPEVNSNASTKVTEFGEEEPEADLELRQGFLEIVNPNPNIDIVNKVAEDKALRVALRETHKNAQFSNYEFDLAKFLDEYYSKRLSSGKEVSLHTANAVYLLAHAMGLRVEPFEDFGLDYPEDLEEIINVMYELINSSIESNRTSSFVLYDRFNGINTEFSEFLKQIERRTHFSIADFGQEREKKIQGIRGFRPDEAERLSRQCPEIVITPRRIRYCVDTNKPNEESITILSSGIAKNVKHGVDYPSTNPNPYNWSLTQKGPKKSRGTKKDN